MAVWLRTYRTPGFLSHPKRRTRLIDRPGQLPRCGQESSPVQEAWHPGSAGRSMARAVVILLFAGLVLPVVVLAAEEKSETASPVPPAGRTLVMVNDVPVTEGDLALLMLTRKVPRELQPQVRKRFLEELVNRRLIRGYLRQRKAEASPTVLDDEVQRLYRLIQRADAEPAEVLARLGHTEATLRDELALPLAWREWVKTAIPTEQLKAWFLEHRLELDGTELRASQIFLKLPRETTAEQMQQARTRLEDLRKQIAAKQLTFAEAARRHSDSPTADRGGDLGFFPYQGRMPQDFTRQVFGLKPGEMSQPFQTSFGMHLVLVTDIRPGQFSLEDVRSEVLRQAGQELWDTTVAAERKKATIRWSEPGDSAAP